MGTESEFIYGNYILCINCEYNVMRYDFACIVGTVEHRMAQTMLDPVSLSAPAYWISHANSAIYQRALKTVRMI